MKTHLIPALLALGILSGLLAGPATAASPARKLVSHWISFSDSTRGTHQPGDVIMLTFNRAGAFAWQDNRRTFSGSYTADAEKLQLTDSSTGETIPYAYRFHRDYLIIEAQDRLTITFIETRQDAAAAEAILAKAKSTPTPTPAPVEVPPGKIVRIAPGTVKPAPAKEPESSRNPSRPGEAKAKADCRKHLEVIHAAIQAYRRDHKDTPNWLSDLVPKYMPAHVLQCPSGRKAAELLLGLDDPKLATSYAYEFCNRPVPAAIRGGSTQTMKQWRQHVMALVGGGTPIVRCHLHDAVLNISFDGEIYESGADWDALPRFSDMVDREKLAPRR